MNFGRAIFDGSVSLGLGENTVTSLGHLYALCSYDNDMA